MSQLNTDIFPDEHSYHQELLECVRKWLINYIQTSLNNYALQSDLEGLSTNLSSSISSNAKNITDLQIVSKKELKIVINKENKNGDLIKALEDFIKDNDNRKYNVKIEYNDLTGLVQYVILTLVEK